MPIDSEFERAKIAARSTRDYLRQVEINVEIKTLQLQIERLESEAMTLDPFLSSCVTGDAIDASIQMQLEVIRRASPADESARTL